VIFRSRIEMELNLGMKEVFDHPLCEAPWLNAQILTEMVVEIEKEERSDLGLYYGN